MTETKKLCIECAFYRKARFQIALCGSPHCANPVDGMPDKTCASERSYHATDHCGPDGSRFLAKASQAD